MRAGLVALVWIAACGKPAPLADAPQPELEGVPAPRCGTGGCPDNDCIRCAIGSELCFGDFWFGGFRDAFCTATPVPSTLEVTIDGTTFTADSAAAVIDSAYLEIEASSGSQTIALLLDATPGDDTCASNAFVGSFAYYTDEITAYSNVYSPSGSRPDCAVSVTSVGDIGQPITGTFSATVIGGASTVELANGTFSVGRVAFP